MIPNYTYPNLTNSYQSSFRAISNNKTHKFSNSYDSSFHKIDLCLSNPEDVYRTCFQRAKDPSNNLTQDTILRDEYNSGSIAPYIEPYVTSDEELTFGTIYLSTVRDDNTTLNCNEKIRLEEISLMWLKAIDIV
jgi:hypothetical protein